MIANHVEAAEVVVRILMGTACSLQSNPVAPKEIVRFALVQYLHDSNCCHIHTPLSVLNNLVFHRVF